VTSDEGVGDREPEGSEGGLTREENSIHRGRQVSTMSSLELALCPTINPAGCPLGRVWLPPVNSPRLLNLNEVVVPGAMLSLVNELRLATRRTMSSGAMTCPFRRHIRQSVQRSGRSRESTNLNLSEDRREEKRGWVFDGPRYDEQQRAHGEQGTRLDEHGSDGLVQSTESG